MRGWWQDLTDLVLPAECGGCGRARTVLCPECRAVLSGAVPSRVRPVPEPSGLPVVHAVARYADEVRAVLLAHKERGALALATPLGTALAGAVRAALWEAGVRGDGPGLGEAWGTDQRTGLREVRGSAGGTAAHGAAGRVGRVVSLVPVPSSRGTVRARGHDPARRIALAAAAELRRAGMPARVVSVLRQGRAVADQTGLDSRQRMANLAGALVVVPGGGRLLSGGPVVLVDDLMTTGASLTEAARAVRVARAGEVASGGDGGGGRVAYGGGAGVPEAGAGAGAGAGVGGGAARARQAAVRGGATRAGRVAPAGTSGDAALVRAVEAGGGAWARANGAKGCGEGAMAVYSAVGREDRGGWMGGATEEEMGRAAAPSGMAGVGGHGDVICAAVVAATPDSFEINRN